MNKIASIIIFLILTIGCSKQPDQQTPAPCVTCTVTVNYSNSYHVHLVYVKSENTYCNGEEKNIQQGVVSGSGNDAGLSWNETTTTVCK